MSSLHYTASLANICQIIAGHISCNSQTLQIITRHDRARDWREVMDLDSRVALTTGKNISVNNQPSLLADVWEVFIFFLAGKKKVNKSLYLKVSQ